MTYFPFHPVYESKAFEFKKNWKKMVNKTIAHYVNEGYLVSQKFSKNRSKLRIDFTENKPLNRS